VQRGGAETNVCLVCLKVYHDQLGVVELGRRGLDRVPSKPLPLAPIKLAEDPLGFGIPLEVE
jgi:hypothetical protein